MSNSGQGQPTDFKGLGKQFSDEEIQSACRLIAKSRYDSVMMEAEQLAYTLMGIKAALEHEGGFDLTLAVIDARLLSWWKCKNRETEIHKDPDLSPA
jgi:hypothetical protein